MICLIMFSLSAKASDPWAYFNPEQVKVFGCKVTDTEYVLNGQSRGEMVWQATAFAIREFDKWDMEISVQPHTVKGLHKAEKACIAWQDEAAKRVYGVHKK